MAAVPSTPRWPTVVLDLDGTLVDTIGLIVDSFQHAYTTVLGEPEDEAVIRSWIGQPLVRAFEERSPERAGELLDAYLRWNHANTERLVRRYAGVDDLLRDLRAAGVRVGVATSKRQWSAGEALRLAGLTGHVETVVAMEDTPAHKPDPAPLLLAVERLGGAPERAVYVGDAVVDVRAARAAGTTAVAVTWGAVGRDVLAAAAPDHLVDTPDDLRAVLLGP